MEGLILEGFLLIYDEHGHVANSHTHCDEHGKDEAHNWQSGQWQEKL